MTKKTTLKTRVTDLMLAHQDMRDNPELLLAAIWKQDLGDVYPHYISVVQFMDLLANKKLTPSWNVRRLFQLVQQHNPNLRGATWEARHNITEPEYRNAIRKDELPETPHNERGEYLLVC